MSPPRVVTGALMGDPRPGRSAADQDAPAPPADRALIMKVLTPKNADKLSAFPETAADQTANWRDELTLETAPIDAVSALRPVAALDLDLNEAQPIPTEPPTIEWMAPSDLLVDESYQRGLSEKSKALITKIATGFDWRRFKPPIIAWTERGFEIIDGQHTAIAAATRGIDKIPVLVTEAAAVQDRALAFVGHNTDRLAVSAMQLHHARVAADDPDAVTIAQVCARAGLTLVGSVYGGRKWSAGESQAIGAIAGLVDRRGAQRAREILQVLVEAGLTPITANHIKALENLTVEPMFVDQLERWTDGGRDDLQKAITIMGAEADDDAIVRAKQLCIPKWQALSGVWFKKTRKRRTP